MDPNAFGRPVERRWRCVGYDDWRSEMMPMISSSSPSLSKLGMRGSGREEDEEEEEEEW